MIKSAHLHTSHVDIDTDRILSDMLHNVPEQQAIVDHPDTRGLLLDAIATQLANDPAHAIASAAWDTLDNQPTLTIVTNHPTDERSTTFAEDIDAALDTIYQQDTGPLADHINLLADEEQHRAG